MFPSFSVTMLKPITRTIFQRDFREESRGDGAQKEAQRGDLKEPKEKYLERDTQKRHTGGNPKRKNPERGSQSRPPVGDLNRRNLERGS